MKVFQDAFDRKWVASGDKRIEVTTFEADDDPTVLRIDRTRRQPAPGFWNHVWQYLKESW